MTLFDWKLGLTKKWAIWVGWGYVLMMSIGCVYLVFFVFTETDHALMRTPMGILMNIVVIAAALYSAFRPRVPPKSEALIVLGSFGTFLDEGGRIVGLLFAICLVVIMLL